MFLLLFEKGKVIIIRIITLISGNWRFQTGSPMDKMYHQNAEAGSSKAGFYRLRSHQLQPVLHLKFSTMCITRMHMRKFQSLHWPSSVAQWLEQLTCYRKVPGLNPRWVITFPWFCHLCQIPGITPVVSRMCKRWQHLVKCAGPMRSWNFQLRKKWSASVCGWFVLLANAR